jgi:hypothetical protein
MPIARIITSMPNQALALAERLRRHGYTVETIAPGETPRGRADLELTLKSAAASEVIKQIVERTAPGSPDVYIAAGALHSRPPVKAQTDPVAPTVADTVNGVAAGLQNKRDLLAKALREQRALLRQARIAERQRMKRAEAVKPMATPIGDEAGAVSDEPATVSPVPPYEALPIEPRQSVPQLSGPPASEASVQEDAAGFIDGREIEVEQEAVQRATAAEPVEVAQGGSRQPEVGPSFHHAAGADAPHTESSRPRRRAVRVVIPGGKRISRRAREWRAAVLISALFAALLMLGWAAATKEPVSPLPRSFSAQTSVEEAVPFGAATLKPAVTSAEPRSPAHIAEPVSTSAEKGRKSETKSTGAEANRSHLSRDRKIGGSKPARSQRHASRNADDEIAEDHVIYHRAPSAPQPVENEKASLKKFSD